jgi:dCMP deaminase
MPMRFETLSNPVAKWDARFIELSKHVSSWSKDPNAKVGAVIIGKRGGAVSLGYNGFPMGVEDSAERLDDKDTKLEIVVHAEENALIAAGSKAEGATIYVWGKPVCARCAGAIIQAGIKRVVALSPENGDPTSRWTKSGMYSLQMFHEAGVEVEFYKAIDEAEPTPK